MASREVGTMHEWNAAHENTGDKSAQVGDHAATDCDEDRATRTAKGKRLSAVIFSIWDKDFELSP